MPRLWGRSNFLFHSTSWSNSTLDWILSWAHRLESRQSLCWSRPQTFIYSKPPGETNFMSWIKLLPYVVKVDNSTFSFCGFQNICRIVSIRRRTQNIRCPTHLQWKPIKRVTDQVTASYDSRVYENLLVLNQPTVSKNGKILLVKLTTNKKMEYPAWYGSS